MPFVHFSTKDEGPFDAAQGERMTNSFYVFGLASNAQASSAADIGCCA
jgi:hypothetical protein